MTIMSLIRGPREARVVAVEAPGPMFRLITLQGEALRDCSWTQGDKLEIKFGGWAQRAYTPISWDGATGVTRLLVYLQAGGRGTQWARAREAGAACKFHGPRGSIKLLHLLGSTLFFGDETSIGLAAALRGRSAPKVEFLFELTAPHESLPVLGTLGISGAQHCQRRDDDTATTKELEARLRALLEAQRFEHVVLSGRSTAIQQANRLVRRNGYSSNQFLTRAYWAPGKRGLD